MYKTEQELVDKVKNDKERLRISEALYSKVEENFDYSLMYKNLFNYLMNYINNNTIQENRNNYYLKAGDFTLDNEISNYIKVINKLNEKKIDYIYFNTIENYSALAIYQSIIYCIFR